MGEGMIDNLFRKILTFAIIIMFIGLSTIFSTAHTQIGRNSSKEPTSQLYLNDLIVYYIDVGQGDSILIQTPDNHFVLIDTGSRSYASKVINFLNQLSVSTLSAFVATHPHEDHIGGCEEIFNAFTILSVYHPEYYINTQTYLRFLNAAQNEGCPIYTDNNVDPGDYIDISNSATCQILHINKYASNANDASIVLRVDYSQVSFLFTGDINGDMGDYVESHLVDSWDVDIDILKVAHHGSRHASTDYFLDEATPDVGIICVGEGNVYGHPHAEALYRLAVHNTDIYRTDLNCDITVTTNGATWAVSCGQQGNEPFPPVISGPSTGTTGVEYQFTAVTTDPNEDQLYYKWDWNDGNISEWLGPYNSGEQVIAYHRWSNAGAYVVRVKAKDVYNFESDWGMLNVIMPINKISTSSLIQRLIERFQHNSFIGHNNKLGLQNYIL